MAVILPLIIIFGHCSIMGIKVAGLTLTIGRVFIPLFVIALLFLCLKNDDSLTLKPGRSEVMTYGVVLVWILYGFLTLALFPYADVHNGALELLALLLGCMTVFCTVVLCRKQVWVYLHMGIKLAVILTMCIAVYEILTANHMGTSKYCDPAFEQELIEIYGEEVKQLKWHIATSIFYNENDYSAMLAVFAAFFMVGHEKQARWMRVVDIVGLCFIFAILYFNDAFICYIAFLLALVIAVIFGMKGIFSRIITILSLVITRILVYVIGEIIGLKLGLSGTLIAQLDNNANGIGSLYYRINTYKVTLQETFVTSKGMGFGAGSFSKYFSQFVDSHMMMSNPHCFWFEILSEYGILVFALFVCLLVVLMVKLIMKYHRTRDSRYALIIAAGAALIIASVAPSNFLKGGYYWLLIGMAIYLINDMRIYGKQKD